MPKVIHTSLREARTLDRENSVSSLWIWNSGNRADTIVTSDDDDGKWHNETLSPNNQSHSILSSSLSILSRTPPSSHSSGGSRKLCLSLDNQKLLALSQSPSPVRTNKLVVSVSAEAPESILLVAPPAATTMDRDITMPPKDGHGKNSYNSNDYGSVGEFSLQEEEDDDLRKPPPPASHSDDDDEDATEREESDSFLSPAIHLSKYVKRIGNSPHSSATSSLLQASDPDMQPRVVEEDDLDSYLSDVEELSIQETEHVRQGILIDEEGEEEDKIQNTAHQREALPVDEDNIQNTAHQRQQNCSSFSSEQVPVSEAAMRQKMIDTELNDMIDEMMQSDQFYEEDMEPESYLALMRAAKEICYTRKYYDVSKDKIIYFPSITKTIVHNDLFEKAEEYYFEQGGEFPADYVMALRGIALDNMVMTEREKEQAADNNSNSAHYSLDDDTMHRMSIRFQRTETDLDELEAFIAAAEAEDELEEEEVEAHQQEKDLPTGAQLAAVQVNEDKKEAENDEEDVLLGAAKAQGNTMWWEVTPDTEQKYSVRKSVLVEPAAPSVQVSGPVEEEVEEAEVEKEPTAVMEASADEKKPQQRRSTWWNLDSESKQKVSKSLKQLELFDDDNGDNDIMKWFVKSESDGPMSKVKVANRICLLLPSKKATPEPSSQDKTSKPIVEEDQPVREGTQVHERSEHGTYDEYSEDESESDKLSSEHERQQMLEATTNKEADSRVLEAVPAFSVDGVSQVSPVVVRNTEGAFQFDQMMPKKRKSKKTANSALSEEDNEKPQQDVIKPDEAIAESVPGSLRGLETNEQDHDNETVDAEDETIDDDDSLSTASFEVEDIIFESKHERGYKYQNHDSAVSSLHASVFGDENDVAPGDAMASLASMMRSTEFGQADTEGVVRENLSTVDDSAPSESNVQVSANKDGRSGTWSIGGTYENVSKEDVTELLKKIQKDIALLIQKGENSTSASKSSSDGFSLVLRPGVEKTLSGITLNSTKVPIDGNVKVKTKASERKVKQESTESGWKKVGMRSPERSERTAIRSNKSQSAPLTNLSHVTEESVAEGDDQINWIFTHKEGRSPASPSRSPKRKIRKGRRKSTGSHDEADAFYDFQLPFSKESNSGACSQERSVPRSQSESKIEQPKFVSSGSSKSSQKRLKSRSNSDTGAQKRSSSKLRRSASVESGTAPREGSKKPRRSVSVESGTVPRGQKRSSSKPRRSASVESGAAPRRAHSSKRGSKKSPKDPTGFESSNAGQSPASLRKSFSNAGRTSSLPTLKETPSLKENLRLRPKKKPSRRLSVENLMPFGRNKSTGDMGPKRKEEMRRKKESSLRELERRLEIVGIQQSPTSVEETKKNPLDLKAKAKEVEGLRDKLRMSLARVIKSP